MADEVIKVPASIEAWQAFVDEHGLQMIDPPTHQWRCEEIGGTLTDAIRAAEVSSSIAYVHVPGWDRRYVGLADQRDAFRAGWMFPNGTLRSWRVVYEGPRGSRQLVREWFEDYRVHRDGRVETLRRWTADEFMAMRARRKHRAKVRAANRARKARRGW